MTQPTPANDNDQRPAEYDAALVKYQNLMRKKANMYVGRDKADDLVADTCLRALRRWRMYNPAYNMGTWLIMLMRSVMHEQRKAANTKMRRGISVDIDKVVMRSESNQENIVDLNRALSAVPEGRDGEVLVRIAMGDKMETIGKEYGVSRQRIKQLEERGREKMWRTLAGNAVVKLAQEAA